ncbi:hypothetical protein M758_3G062900 [Ceratodon purpureus]|nr:hypothetical protein M758_3G062900 [Ceratodon purpureus]
MKLWGRPSPALDPCWTNPPRKINTRKEWGYVLVTCSQGPHHHRYQIANAVIVARQLGATLVMPTIKEGLTELASNFDDVYNVKHFIASLEGVVRVMGRLPEELRKANQTSVEIPYTMTKKYIEQTVRPVFKANQIIVLDRFLPSLKDGEEEQDEEIGAIRCLVHHQALLFLSQIEKIGTRVNNRMMEAGQKAGGKYIAVDYRSADKLCDQNLGDSLLSKNRCLPALDLGLLLQSHGFPPETAIFLTQTHLDESFDPLLNLYPNVISKEYTMPFNEENQFLYTGKTQFELAVDFYVCSHSEVFVGINSDTFYVAVAGERIRQGLTHVLVPKLQHSKESSEPILTLGASQLVTHKTHPAYSCFCKKGMNKKPTRELEKSLEPSSETSD